MVKNELSLLTRNIQEYGAFLVHAIKQYRRYYFRSVKGPPLRYALVFILVSISFFLQFTSEKLFNRTINPFVFSSLIVMVCAWYGGFGTGVLTTILSGGIAAYFIDSNTHAIRLGMHLLEGVFISVVSDALRSVHYQSKIHLHQLLESRVALKMLADREHTLNKKIMNILESISDAFISVDTKWRIIYMNHPAELLFRVNRQTMVRQSIWTLFPAAVIQTMKSSLIYAVAEDTPQFIEVLRPADSRWLSIHMYHASDAISLYIQDITKRKTEERQKDNFISVASHELKSPLTTMKAFSQLLIRHVDVRKDPQTAAYVQKMNTQVDRMTNLTTDLLDITRIQTGRFQLSKERVNVEDLVGTVVSECQKNTTSHRILLRGKTEGAVLVDPERMKQVFINLITNAIKYSPHGDTIIVRIGDDDKLVTISVQDYGIGIPKEEQKNIFLPYYQIQQSTQRSSSNIGLGLYIASEIVRHHHGSIQVASERGKGSTFTVYLPKMPLPHPRMFPQTYPALHASA